MLIPPPILSSPFYRACLATFNNTVASSAAARRLRLRRGSPRRLCGILLRCAVILRRRAYSVPLSGVSRHMRFVLAPPVPVLFQRKRARFPLPRGNIPPHEGLLPFFGRHPPALSDADLKLMFFCGSYWPLIFILSLTQRLCRCFNMGNLRRIDLRRASDFVEY
jgi:hypothetical protein